MHHGTAARRQFKGDSRQQRGVCDRACWEYHSVSRLLQVGTLVRNLPPFGDKQWHLYNLRVDPTEANDISSTKPDLVKTLTAAYADYIKKYGVVEVPDDYSVVEQAKKNMARGNH
jgi:hypothetical protein